MKNLRMIGAVSAEEPRMSGMTNGVVIAVGVFAAILMSSSSVHAQWEDDPYDTGADTEAEYEYGSGYEYADDSNTGFGAKLGIGFTASPEAFLIDLAIPYHFGGGVSAGPRLQLGLEKETNFIAPTINVEYSHDFSETIGGTLGKIRPLVSAGLGFAWVEDENRNGDNSQTDFLFNIGVGMAYPLSEKFEVATVLDFNVLPKEPLDDEFVFSWQVVQMRLRF